MHVDTLRILHIEDNPDDRRLMKDLLVEVADHGLEITSTDTLKEAVSTCLAEQPDAVLLDLNLPDSKGIDTFRTFSSHCFDVPVVVLTMLDLEGVAIEAVRAGAQDYLVKNQLSGPLLVRALRYAVERKAIQDSLREYREQLELLVRKRTSELVERNRLLQEEIGEHKRTEITLREQQELLQSILDGMEAAVFFIDVESYTIVKTNRVAEKMLDVGPDCLVGKKCYEFICIHGKTKPENGCPALGKRSLHVEFKLELPDGRTLPVTKTVLPATINGRLHHVAILFDMTERKAMERQLAYAQKLESVGQLAAGIAHEINTPIQYVGSNITFFKNVFKSLQPTLQSCDAVFRTLPPQERDKLNIALPENFEEYLEEIPEAIKDALEGVERISSIVLAMKQFSHPDMEETTAVDLNECISNTITIARNEWKYVADVETHLQDDLPHIDAVPGDINQVLLNVLVNAAHAIRDKEGQGTNKGTITIRTECAGDMAEVSIADTGCGIPETLRNKVFDPFFTTKEVGQGTGQGLAIAMSVVNKHGGSIDYASKLGEGTTFHIRFPLHKAAQGKCP